MFDESDSVGEIYARHTPGNSFVSSQPSPHSPASDYPSTSERFHNSTYFLGDHRIIPADIAVRDAFNEDIWIHPDDLARDHEMALRFKLENNFTVIFPQYTDDPVRNAYIGALKEYIPPNTSLSTTPPTIAGFVPLGTDPYDFPLSHRVNGEPPPTLPSEASHEQLKQAVAAYVMLEHALEAKGHPTLLATTLDALHAQHIPPTADHLFSAMEEALGVDAHTLLTSVQRYGATGMSDSLQMDIEESNAIIAMVNESSKRFFPLNDFINWEFGRRDPRMRGEAVEDIIEFGMLERVDAAITEYRHREHLYQSPNDYRKAESHLASLLDEKVPPLVAELFFEEGGQIIYTTDHSLQQVWGEDYHGYFRSYPSTRENPMSSSFQVFVAGAIGDEETGRTLVHEIHHMMYPRKHITREEAYQADILLDQDEKHIHQLKDLTELFQLGTPQEQQMASEELDRISLAHTGKPLTEMLNGTSIHSFIKAVDEAYKYLQMESWAYEQLKDTYPTAYARHSEIIPHYAEMKYIGYDNQEMVEFITPNITKIYNDIYIPHLQDRIDEIHASRDSRVDIVTRRFDKQAHQPQYFTGDEHIETYRATTKTQEASTAEPPLTEVPYNRISPTDAERISHVAQIPTMPQQIYGR